MFSDDEQFHHDMSVMRQEQPMTPGAFNNEEPAKVDPPDPESIWLAGFSLLVLMVALRAVPWYWVILYPASTLAWLYYKAR